MKLSLSTKAILNSILSLGISWIFTSSPGYPTSVDSLEQAINRQDILKRMERVMGPLPGKNMRARLDVQVSEEVDAGTYIRKKLTYQSAPGERVNAYLLIPKTHEHPLPAILCLHQTTDQTIRETIGLAGRPNMHYGSELAERGFVVVAPEYPMLGDHQIQIPSDRWASGSMKAIWDNMGAIDLLQSMHEVDPNRIGAIGHSLGGHNALFTAAFDPRIKCVVTSCGFTAFARYYGGNLKGWSSNRYMPRITTDFPTPNKMPFDFSDVLLAISPRSIFVSAPLHDANFDVVGVRETVAQVEKAFRGRLEVTYPDCEHDWPEESRRLAYAFLRRELSKASPPPEAGGYEPN